MSAPYADRVARTPDGRPLGRPNLSAPLQPVREPFAYVWETPEEAAAVALQWETDQNAGDAEYARAARTAAAMGTATAAEAALVAALDAVHAEYAEAFPRG